MGHGYTTASLEAVLSTPLLIDSGTQAVVKGTWLGGYDVDENELSIHEKRHASGLKVGVDFRTQQ